MSMFELRNVCVTFLGCAIIDLWGMKRRTKQVNVITTEVRCTVWRLRVQIECECWNCAAESITVHTLRHAIERVDHRFDSCDRASNNFQVVYDARWCYDYRSIFTNGPSHVSRNVASQHWRYRPRIICDTLATF